MKFQSPELISVSDFKKNPSASTQQSNVPLGVLNHNEISFYAVTPRQMELMNQRLEELEKLARTTDEYKARHKLISQIEAFSLEYDLSLHAIQSNLMENGMFGNDIDIPTTINQRDISRLTSSELNRIYEYLKSQPLGFYDVFEGMMKEKDVKECVNTYIEALNKHRDGKGEFVPENPHFHLSSYQRVYVKILEGRTLGDISYNTFDLNNISLEKSQESTNYVFQLIDAARLNFWTDLIIVTDRDDIEEYESELLSYGFMHISIPRPHSSNLEAMGYFVKGTKKQESAFKKMIAEL